jgi:hypothetical protein
MARIRTIKPEFWQDEKLSPCDPLTRLVFLGLVSLADDAGRLVDNLRLIDAQIFPNTSDTAHEALMRLSGMGRIKRGKTASGQRIIEICNWSRHQKIQHPNLRGSLPEIVEEWEVTEIHEPLMSHSGAAHEPLTHHTNDQRPVPTTSTGTDAPRKRVVREKTGGESKHPHFVEPYRSQVFDAWKKLGAVNGGRLVNAIGPCFRPPEDAGYVPPEYVVMGVVDYCGLVPQGKGAPFAGPEDCAKRLMTLARNCERLDRVDPVARIDANFMAIHGHRMPGAGAA